MVCVCVVTPSEYHDNYTRLLVSLNSILKQLGSGPDQIKIRSVTRSDGMKPVVHQASNHLTAGLPKLDNKRIIYDHCTCI